MSGRVLWNKQFQPVLVRVNQYSFSREQLQKRKRKKKSKSHTNLLCGNNHEWKHQDLSTGIFITALLCYVKKKIRTEKIIKLLTKSLCVHNKEFLLVIKVVPHHKIIIMDPKIILCSRCNKRKRIETYNVTTNL